MVNNDKSFKNLTRGTKDIIKNAIVVKNTTNRYELCDYICDSLVSKFKGNTLDYQLKRMDLETTTDVLDAIDTYMYKHIKDSKTQSVDKENQE